MNNGGEVLYKIILDDVYPQCCAYGLTEEETVEKLQELRDTHKNRASLYRVFTVDGDSRYW